MPARAGSKGLPGKNLRTFCGVPLVALAGNVARQVEQIDRFVVSTDSVEIAGVAERSGLAAPFMRPLELSGDLVGDVDVLLHALRMTEDLDNCRYDIVVMLQPTSPLRTAEEIRGCLETFAANNADSVWSVSPADKKYHPLKQLRAVNGRLSYYDAKGAAIIARQQLDELYFRNGVAYVVSRSCLMDDRSLMGKRSFAYITMQTHISIDTAEDLELAQQIARKSGMFGYGDV